MMRRRGKSRRLLPADERASPASRRDRIAVLFALATIVVVTATFVLAHGTRFLMPGPLASAHGAIEACSACHTGSGDGKLSWVRGLVTADRMADSKACVSCHKMPETAFDPHGAAAEILQRSTARLAKVAAETPVPRSVRAQGIAFPTETAVTGGLACATCHQEHQGAGFELARISNEKCQSCHALKFDSFDGHHPEFGSYPFRRRTRIVFDHAGHFGKHFPETAAKTPGRTVPAACSTCHDSGRDKRLMAVLPFDQTCSSCHLDQITGKERISGPKGIAFLSLPGLDLPTLKKKKLAIGEWPDASEAPLTPFMKILIGRSKKGDALLKKVAGLNLQDLSGASNDQVKAVAGLAWEVKALFYAFIKGQASDVLGELDIGGSKLAADTIAELTASFPRDVIVGAQLQWLPNLGAEMENRPEAADLSRGGSVPQSKPEEPGSVKAARGARPGATARAKSAAGSLPEKGGEPALEEKQAEPKQAEPPAAKPSDSKRASVGRPPPKAADQTDDLLFPTEEEQRAMKSGAKGERKAAQPQEAPAKAAASAAKSAEPEVAAKPAGPPPASAQPGRATPVVGIESDVEPENWAAYGGWYRQDNAIFYRPVGHKDKLIYSWLRLVGPVTSPGETTPLASVFAALTDKDAQGSCTKCHSVDTVGGKARAVNFTPKTTRDKHGVFTTFIHEPHFSVVGNRGCLACHSLEKSNSYLKSYEQPNPRSFASNFGPVKKELCQSCHTSGAARQDCLTCHKYHVHGAATPIMNTKIPTHPPAE